LRLDSSKKVRSAAWMFKQRVGEFMQEYKTQAYKTRESLNSILQSCEHEQRSSSKEGKEGSAKNEWKIKRNFDVVMRLTQLGRFIGTIQTPACQKCLQDSKDLKALFDRVYVKVKSNSGELKKYKSGEQNVEQNRKMMMIDDLHKQKYLEIYNWVIYRTGNVTAWMNLSRKRSVGLTTILAKLNKLLDKLPGIRDQISEQLTGWSSYLNDQNYENVENVLARETDLEGTLIQLEVKVKKEYQRCVLVLYAQTIRDTLFNVYELTDDKLKNICLLIVLYAYHTDEAENVENEIMLCLSESNKSYPTRTTIVRNRTDKSVQKNTHQKMATLIESPRKSTFTLNERARTPRTSGIKPDHINESPIRTEKSKSGSSEGVRKSATTGVFGAPPSLTPISRSPTPSVLNIGSDDDLADSEEQQMEAHVKVLELRAIVAKLRFRVGELEVVEKRFHNDSLMIARVERQNRELLEENRQLKEELSRLKSGGIENNYKPSLNRSGRTNHRLSSGNIK